MVFYNGVLFLARRRC